MRKILFVSVLIIVLLNKLSAQTNVLEDYVHEGLESNLVIKQNQMSLESAQQALKEAKGMFLPTVTSQSRYTLAAGGRTIDFPIGDLMNPVYGTLNDMLVSQGGTAQFPMVENEQIRFLREQEYEAKISITQPIYYPSIAINKRIEEKKLFMTQTETEQYINELTFQIKEAYYNYNKALQYFDLIQETKKVVNENHRVSQKLLENSMINRDAVLRAKSEISKVELFETEAVKNREMAKSYFNFLLNRNLDEEIITCSQAGDYLIPEFMELSQNAMESRDELKLLDNQINIMDDIADLNQAAMLPKFLIAVDYGIQGEELNINKDSDFLTGSFVLTWDLFSGNTNKIKKKQALIEKQRLKYYKEEVSNKIQLEVKQNVYEVEQQFKNLNLAQTRKNESVEVYRILEKRYRLGEASLIELLDARNNMTESEAQLIITKFDYLVSISKLEKSTKTKLSI